MLDQLIDEIFGRLDDQPEIILAAPDVDGANILLLLLGVHGHLRIAGLDRLN
jgi:hypothetical protein